MKKLIKLLSVLTVLLSISALTHSQTFLSEKKYVGDPLYDFITYWWRSPYRYGGTTKKGIDCSAFTGKLYKNVYNISLPRTASQQYKASKRIIKDSLRDGDLVFFRTKVKSGWHVGVYIVDGWFIQSSSHKGVSIASLNDPWYARHYHGAGRVIVYKPS